MGGRPKGLLRGPDGRTLVERLLAVGAALDLETVLVGEASAYASVAGSTPALADRGTGLGPLGGLASLLAFAGERRALALSCDLPFVEAGDVRALLDHPSKAAVLAGRAADDAPFEPFFARYDPPRVMPELEARIAAQDLSLQRLLRAVDAEAHRPSSMRALADWDTPDDVARAFDDPEPRG